MKQFPTGNMRRLLAGIALALGILCAHDATAEDFGKSAVAQTLMKQAAKAQAAPNTDKIQAPKPASPFEMQESIPEDVDTLMERIEAQNRALVDEFEALIQKDPLNPDAPKWLAEVAEFHWQTAHYAYLRARRTWLAQLDSCEDDCPEEPQADYHAAIDDYRRILSQYPTYPKLDEVLFRLGDALIRNRQPREGVSYLHRLTQEYPEYPELDAAYLALGEFYFSQKNTGTAQAAYQTLLDRYPKSSFRQYAQYKLAWTYLNLADEDSYLEAIRLFKDVVESIDAQYADAIDSNGQIDENKLKTGEITFRNQALNDLSTAYVELDDGWKQARAYLSQKLPEDKAREKIEQLGAILDAHGKFEEEIELYGDLIAAYPMHAHVIDWRTSRIEAFRQSNRIAEAEAATRDTIALTNPDSAWYKAQNDSARAHADRFIPFQLYTLAMASITAAEKEKDAAKRDAYWADAETLLRQDIAQYGDQKSAFDIHYTYAYVLDERSDGALETLKKQYGKRLKSEPELAADVLGLLREAAGAYQKIIDWPQAGDDEQAEQIRVAANRQVFVYANILATSDPEWSIVNSAKTTGFVEEKRGSQRHDAEPLSEAELGFVRSARQYASRYPRDEETPAFLWRAAEIYRTHYDYNEAASRFDEIISNFPDHQYAAVAVGSMFELYYKADNYAKIEYWAKWLIEHRNFKHYTAHELEDTASFAIDKQAVALADAGNTDDAVSTILRIESSFPARKELSTAARFKAASFEETRHHWAAAAQLLQPLEAGADSPENAAHASFRIGMDRLQIARFIEAADAFERSANARFDAAAKDAPKPAERPAAKKGKKNATPPAAPTLPENIRIEAAQATYYAAQIYASEQPDRAVALLARYAAANESGDFDLYRAGDALSTTASAEAVPVLTSAIATIERARLIPADEAITSLSAFAGSTAFAREMPALQRQVHMQWAQTAADSANLDAARKALALLSPDENSWNRAELARYHYLLGRSVQLDFEGVVLEFPIRTLRKRIEQKAKLRQTAEKHFQKAISYKNAQVSTASAYELAQMALHFRDAFKQLPPPKELENDPDGLEEYTIWIEDELIFPAEDAAASLLDVARQITLQLQSYTPQAQKSAATLATLKPDDYPVAKPSVF